MYFFDFEDYCFSQVIGTNSVNIFTTPTGTTCSDIASTYRATRDDMVSSVAQWYDVSNPYDVTYQYSSTNFLNWPSTNATYTLYNGGFTSVDDGYTNTPIPLLTKFKLNGLESSNLYVSTNGYFTLGSGRGEITSTPTVGPPPTICGNPGDNWLQPGLTNSDGDVQNLYYKIGEDGYGRYNVRLLVYGGQYGSSTTPTSWIANFYRDYKYQWIEVRAKSNLRGNVGPYNATDVSQASSTTSKVWRGDLNGQNWVYLGTGSVYVPGLDNPPPRVCPECDTYYNQYITATATGSIVSNFWLDAENNFANTTQADFTNFVEEVYHQNCLLKQLLKCVDGDTFPTFDI